MDAIKKIKTKLEEYKNQQEKNELLSDVGIHIVTKVIDEAIKIVDKVAAEEAGNNDGWIPVSERVPEKTNDEYYPMSLVTLEDGDVTLGVYRYDDKAWWTRHSEAETGYSEKHKVIAWQPLPQQNMPHERKE